jgi:hypothetical protein
MKKERLAMQIPAICANIWFELILISQAVNNGEVVLQ